MDWFEKLTGFRETGYEETRARLEVEGGRLRSRINGASYGIGELELVSLQALRERAKSAGNLPGRVKTSVVTGDVRRMHRSSENAGALFQVASQFNLLEMVSPDVTPEHGVTRYQSDPTQGPACAIAAGAATIYRNYFVPIEGSQGQTATRQLDGLADLGAALSGATESARRQSMDDAERLRIGYPNGTRCDRSTSRNACARPDRCPARKTAHRNTSRCRSHRSSGAGSAAGLSVILLGTSGRLQSCAACSLGAVRVACLGGRIRSHDVGRRAERATRRIKCRFPDASRRRRLRQSRQLDPRRHEAGPGIDDDLRSRREARELRDTVKGDSGDCRGVSMIVARPHRITRLFLP